MFEDDGVLLIKNFINEKDLTALNAELDEVFSQISINGGSYSNNVFALLISNVPRCAYSSC